MSRGLQDLAGLIARGEVIPAYDPGEVNDYLPLVEAVLAEHFLDTRAFVPFRYYGVDVNNKQGQFKGYVRRYKAFLEPEIDEEFQHQVFLDTLLRRMGDMDEPERPKPLDTLLTPLVQTLYDLGRNGFHLDATMLPRKPDCMMTYLRGEPGSLLRVQYQGVCSRFGDFASNVRLETSGSVRRAVGYHSKDSEFVLHGLSSSVGDGADSSTFILTYHRAISSSAEGCTFYITQQIPDGGWVGQIREYGFYANGNTLYEPGPDAQWKEVLRR